NMTGEQKQTLSVLGTLAAGLAGGLAGDSSANAVAGAQAGKNAAENNSLSGDKARAAVKENTEVMKAQVREKMGDNIASQLTNGVLNAVSEAGDLAMAGGDTVLDAAMALASCATGDNYCSTAINDLNKKDQAAGNALNSLVNGDAWNAIKTTAVKAYQGDQVALENLAGVLTGIVAPSSKVPFTGKGSSVTEQTVKTTNSISDHVKSNIALSEKARESSNFAIHSAKSDQLQWGYAADEWSMTTLPAGSKVYGGIPGQSAYYTTEQTLLNANFGRESLFQSLQVSPHPEFGYRPTMGVYEVINPIVIPSGIVWENPLLGPGGGTQFFIKDYNNNLKLIDKIDLGK
ncbi:VENN motif pre-toxin domain-containing protein, partial [Buttiauxella sp. A2-C2_NF]|uniref:VENN motif pre-toxin domain-containing protein n=1 Tax=Buttiauxella ferragutiae TaxID=82989 RepID=UPI001E2840B8